MSLTEGKYIIYLFIALPMHTVRKKHPEFIRSSNKFLRIQNKFGTHFSQSNFWNKELCNKSAYECLKKNQDPQNINSISVNKYAKSQNKIITCKNVEISASKTLYPF